MKALSRGLLVAAVQVLLVGSVGAKFIIDRVYYPRVWIATQAVDPDLPVRGRYIQVLAVVDTEGPVAPNAAMGGVQRVRLAVRNDALVAIWDGDGHQWIRQTNCGAARCWVLTQPLAYFIPEHGKDPTRHNAGEELWVEASIPPTGPPRPIRLGRKSEGKISVIETE
jgi:hypothetical protein